MPETPPPIFLKSVNYWYPFQEKPVLNNVNLNVEKGEMALLIGPTGCGKSTLCLCLTGMIPHKLGGKLEGEVIVNGVNVLNSTVSEMAKHIGIVFQNPDEQLTCLYVEDEVAFGPENLMLPPEEVKSKVNEALEFVGLSEFKDRIVYDLSGGQKQRLAIAAVLAMRPSVLVLDAPISNLDPRGASEILHVIDDIRKEHKLTTLIVEHKIDELITLVDRVLVMDKQGRVVMNTDPKSILEKLPYLRDELGLWAPQLAEIVTELKNKGFSIDEIPLTLEEATSIFSKLNIKLSTTEGKKVSKELKSIEPIISVKDLTLVYPDGTVAVKDVSFDVLPGEFVTIVGQNGSGKTTTAYNLIGVLKPTKGQVIIAGKDTKKTPIDVIARDITYVFQYPEHQFIDDKVYKEIAFELNKRKDIYGEDIDKKVDEILNEIGLLEYKDRHPYNLSLGEKRLLSASEMTLIKPKIIILDEPTYGQDMRHNYRLMNYMADLNRKGTTIVMITHDMRLVTEYASRVIAMKDGRLVYDGELRKFFSDFDLLKDLQLEPPPVIRLSMKIFNEPLLTVNEFLASVSS
ncbi:MAG: energy-coupling factor transporter ATPase [Candidatus Bathyarchaeia archaeon]